MIFDFDPKVKGSRSHRILPSTLYILWPMCQQNLMLLHPTVKEKMHLQEIHYLTLRTSISCDLCIYKVWSCYVKMFGRRCIYKKINYLTLTRNVAQYSLHHVTSTATKIEVAMSNHVMWQTDGWRIDFCTKLIYPFFFRKKGVPFFFRKKGV